MCHFHSRFCEDLGDVKPIGRKEFLKLIKRNQTVVLVGETGSGKTTQLPQFLLEAAF